MSGRRGRTGLVVACALRAELPARLRELGVRGAVVGVAGSALAEALRAGLFAGEGPVLITGTCGALVEGHQLGALALPAEVVDEHGALEPDARLREELHRAVAGLGRAAEAARLVQARSVVDSAGARGTLARESGASFVDLESARVARACAAAGRPWAVLRFVSDSPAEPLDWLADMLGGFPTSEPPLGRVLGGLVRRPHFAPRLVRLGLRMSAGRAVVRRVVASLPD